MSINEASTPKSTFGARVNEMSVGDLAGAITGYDLRHQIEALVSGITAKQIRHIYAGRGACTSPEIMVLPTLPQLLMFCKRERDILLGYAAHEICHQLETNFDLIETIFADLEKPTTEELRLKDWWNAIEDYRIEKLSKKPYPGFARLLNVLRDHATGQYLAAVANGLYSPEELANPYRLGALALTWVGGKLNGYPTTTHEQALLTLAPDLQNWIRAQDTRLAAVETPEEALNLARDLLEELDQQNETNRSEDDSLCPEHCKDSESQTSQDQQPGSSSSQCQSSPDGKSGNEEDKAADNDDAVATAAGGDDDASDEGQSEQQDSEETAGGANGASADPEEGADSDTTDADNSKDQSAAEEGESDAPDDATDTQAASGLPDDGEGEADEGDADPTTPAPDDEPSNSSAGETDKTSDDSEGDPAPADGAEEHDAGSSVSTGESKGDKGEQSGADKGEADNDPATGADVKATGDSLEKAGTPETECNEQDDKGDRKKAPAAPKTTEQQRDAQSDKTDLNIDDLMEALADAVDQFDDVEPCHLDPLCLDERPENELTAEDLTFKRETIKRAQKSYAEARKGVGPAAARSAGIVRRMLQSHNRIRHRQNREEGALDLQRLVPIVNGAPDVYRDKKVTRAINTAVCILLDNSGSMGKHRMDICQKAAITLDQAITGTSTDLEILGFTGDTMEPVIYQYRKFGQKGQAASATLGGMMGISKGLTPVSVPLLEAHRRLQAHKAPRKILIVISDGGADDPARARDAHDLIVAKGCSVVAIGIETDQIRHWSDNYEVIDDVDELPTALTSLVQNLIKPIRKAA